MNENKINLTMPEADASGFIKTLNNMGFMTDYLDEFSEEFVGFSASCGGTPVLDIGCAFGNVTIPALKAGAHVIANDIDPRHLEILENQAKKMNLEKRLKLLPGRFPDDLTVAPESLGAVLACRVFHFFDGEQVEKGVKKVTEWLKPGGKFFLVGETPYVGGVKHFIPIYEERRRKRVRWPGYVEDFMKIDPIRGKDLPPSMHLLDEEVLSRTFEEAGLIVERAIKFSRPRFPENLRLDGRESVGIIGRKK